MRSAIAIILLNFAFAQAHAKELAADQSAKAQDSLDELVDKLVDKMFDRVSPSQPEVKWTKNKDGSSSVQTDSMSSTSQSTSRQHPASVEHGWPQTIKEVVARSMSRQHPAPFAYTLAHNNAPVAAYSACELLSNGLQLFNAACVARLILTWFPEPPMAVVRPLSQVTDPYLGLFRGLIPPIGGMDFSPLLAFFLLGWVTRQSRALPAEPPSKFGTVRGNMFDESLFHSSRNTGAQSSQTDLESRSTGFLRGQRTMAMPPTPSTSSATKSQARLPQTSPEMSPEGLPGIPGW